MGAVDVCDTENTLGLYVCNDVCLGSMLYRYAGWQVEAVNSTRDEEKIVATGSLRDQK